MTILRCQTSKKCQLCWQYSFRKEDENYAHNDKKFLTGASPFALAKSIRCVNVLCVYIDEKLIHGTALGTLAKTAE